jgi:hypothetical protein
MTVRASSPLAPLRRGHCAQRQDLPPLSYTVTAPSSSTRPPPIPAHFCPCNNSGHFSGAPFCPYTCAAATAWPWTLLKAKVRFVVDPIRQAQKQLSAGASPFAVCLPDVRVLVRRGVIGQAALAQCIGDLHVIDEVIGVAGDALGLGIARLENGQPPILAQAKLHGDRLPGLHDVED